MLKSILSGDPKRIAQRTYFWNFAANILFSLQSALLLLIVSRFGTLDEAGVFSIINTTTLMLTAVGHYNMRNFQVSDVENEYRFPDYWSSRILTCVLMFAAGAGYGVIRYGINDYLFVVLLFAGYRVTDCVEDVIHGLMQKEGRLDAASYAKTIRIFLSTVLFSGIYIVSKQLILASSALFLSSLLFLVYSVGLFNREFDSLTYNIQFTKVWKLLWVCLPLCASSLIQTYIINSPKYAIDRLLSSETQAVFNILFMPIFSMNVLVMFVFNPLIANLSKVWKEGRTKEFLNTVVKQIVILCGLTAVASIASYLVGCELLGWVYGVDLKAHKVFLMILMIFGGISAMVTFMSIIVTIMRKQKYIIVSYFVALIFSFLLSDTMVRQYGMEGAGYLYGILMIIVSVSLTFIMISGLKKSR